MIVFGIRSSYRPPVYPKWMYLLDGGDCPSHCTKFSVCKVQDTDFSAY